MPVDTTIQFNGHNTYRITTTFLCYPFGVQGMTHITHSFQAYATTIQAAQTRAKTKFLAADGTTISNVTHDFAIGTVFDKVEITVPVPANAVSAQLILLRGTTDWWIAEPKSEYGEIATPYNVNYAGQLTYITPTGVYTGMMTTNQIVVAGSINQPTETLGTRLVTINNGMINLTSTLSSKTTKITNEGVYTGEVVASQMTTGVLKSLNGYSQLNLDNGTFNFGNGALAWNGSSLTARGSFESVGGTQSAKIDQGSVRLANNGVDMGYFSVQAAEPTGPYITAANSATKIKLGKVVGTGIYNGFLLDWDSPTGTTARAYINGGEICHIGGAALQCGGIGPVTSSAWVQVTFPKPFPGPPVVLVAPELSEEGVSAPKIRNVTETGFQVTIGGTGTTAPSVNWIAMQY